MQLQQSAAAELAVAVAHTVLPVVNTGGNCGPLFIVCKALQGDVVPEICVSQLRSWSAGSTSSMALL